MSVHAATRAAHTKTRPITLLLPEPMVARMEERARIMGRRLTDYVRLLLDAAYAARCAHEKGEASYDRDLDRQVRLVFLLSDCEPDFIAETLGLPKARVKAIVEGWKSEAGEMAAKPALLAPAPAPDKLDAPREKAVRSGGGEALFRKSHGEMIAKLWAEGSRAAEIGVAIGSDADRVRKFAERNRDLCPARSQVSSAWPDETVETVRTMWADGASLSDIAAKIGKTRGAVGVWMSSHREICPHRQGGKGR